ncbi:MAG: family 20 glycosylhydrolase, partial [Planctomycetes bacterium]|nr:family 20 glycosylhydrolase [Planctomycetota bacterium]
MYLLPPVKHIKTESECFRLSDISVISFQGNAAASSILPAQQLAQDLQLYANIFPPIVRSLKTDQADIRLNIDIGLSDLYQIEVDKNGVFVRAQSDSGLFYACQTLRQIVKQCGRSIPHLKINDYADFPSRGLYHDITRGKVPTFDGLCEMVEKCAYYKINQLQLYIEHTFAFQKHKNIAAGKSPITAEEIMALDDLCQSYHIELIPSLTTFGHCYEILRCKRLEHLGEIDIKGSEYDYSWWDRQAHFTLDSQSPDAFAFVEDMLDEFIPLFSSEHFNICCDETVDLADGRHVGKVDPAKLYIDFTKQIIEAVAQRGRKVQMWGDILQEHPECIKDIPKDTTVLNWSYDPALTRGECEPFAEAGLPFYVCPGTTGWSHFFADIHTASQNISNFAKEGKKHGAIGLLNTDWGDYGHPGLFGASFHGIALGAACAWDAEADSTAGFDEIFSHIELGDASGRAAAEMRAFSSHEVININNLALIFDPLTEVPSQWRPTRDENTHFFDAEKFDADVDYAAIAEKMRNHRNNFIHILSQYGALAEEIIQDMVCGMWGEILINEAAYLVQCGRNA